MAVLTGGTVISEDIGMKLETEPTPTPNPTLTLTPLFTPVTRHVRLGS